MSVNLTVFDPDSGNTRTIVITIGASMVIQDLLGDYDFFVTLTTTAKNLNGGAIPQQVIRTLADGAGGTGLDRFGDALPNAGKYANLSTAIDDYVGLMVEGVQYPAAEPWTAMAFV